MENFYHAKQIRWQQRYENFDKSYRLLVKYAANPPANELERAGLIQFFEMTLALSWKVLKDFLESQGTVATSPRDTIKHAFSMGYITDAHTFLHAIGAHNLTSHTYNEALAQKLIDDIRNLYLPILQEVHQNLAKELS